MPADHDRLDPSGYGPWDALEDDRLAEDGATEDVADLCASRGKEPRQRKVLWRRRRGWKGGCGEKSGSAGTDGRTVVSRC
jgi:hypothetical protein